MKYKTIEALLLSFNGASVSLPFDNKTPVFKVGGKMFALVGLEKNPLSMNLKCDPDDAQLLRSQFEAIIPGYHMNKEHWNTVLLDGSLDLGLTKKLMADSYQLVVNKLSQKKRLELGL